MTIGVYQITCVPTGKRYIGSSCDIEERWKNHCSELNRDIHHNSHLQNAWNRYGAIAFQFEILEKCALGEEKNREQYHLDESEPEFNILSSASGYAKGHVHSLEARIKISEAGKGNRYWAGRKHTSETIAKMSATHKGKIISQTQRDKTSNTLKNRAPEDNSFHGKKHSVQSREKMSIAHKGKKHSETTKAKIGFAHKGMKRSPETCRNISEALKKFHRRQKEKTRAIS